MLLLSRIRRPFIKRKKQIRFFVLLITTQISFSAIPFTSAYSRTWYIKADGTGDAPTIQAGVDSAAVGDTVLVGQGNFSDTRQILVDGVSKVVNVYLYKDVRVIAEELGAGVTIDGSLSDIAVYAKHMGPNSELGGFYISTEFFPYACINSVASEALQPEFKIGIRCESSSITIRGNHLLDNGVAVQLQHSPVTIVDNVINRSFYGIECVDTSDAYITGNIISDCATGIDCYKSSPQIILNDISIGCEGISCRVNSPTLISQNNIHMIGVRGVAILNSGIVVEDNSFSINEIGVSAQGNCDGLVIARNLFYNHNSSAISFVAVPSALIEYNTIDSVAYWAVLLQGSHPAIRNNIITRSPVGMDCLGGSSPFFECNDLYAVNFRYTGDCTDQTDLNGNISADPEYCGIDNSGNYFLQSDSPCAPGNHPTGFSCDQIGKYGVNCETVNSQHTAWGSIKNTYRNVGNHD